MISKNIGEFTRVNKQEIIFRKSLKRRQAVSDSNGSVDIRIILNDDLFTQQTTCLTELIDEKFEILFFLEIKRKSLVL